MECISTVTTEKSAWHRKVEAEVNNYLESAKKLHWLLLSQEDGVATYRVPIERARRMLRAIKGIADMSPAEVERELNAWMAPAHSVGSACYYEIVIADGPADNTSIGYANLDDVEEVAMQLRQWYRVREILLEI